MSVRKIWNAQIAGRTDRQVVKTGHVLTLKEEAAESPGGSSGVLTGTSIPNVHYQIFCAPGACDICAAHNGEIHPVVMGRAGVDLPPFHPNCKCTVKGYEISQGPYDPAARERELWAGLMISRLNPEQQASMLVGFYRWEDIDPQDVIAALTAVSELEDVGMRIEGFFEEMGMLASSGASITSITLSDLEEFGWHKATHNESNRLKAAFNKAGITLRESIIQFMAIAAAESGYGQKYLEEGNDAYWGSNGYDRNTRGAGYIQVTHDYNHQAFLDYIGDDFSGEDTASYISKNYPLEVSVWFWSKLNLYGYEGGVNEFIESKINEGAIPLLVFLKTSYYVGGMPLGSFNNDINDVISGKSSYEITDTHFIVSGNRYPLPSRWSVRLEAYEKAQAIW